MTEQLEKRLKELESEYNSGQKVLAELEQRQVEIKTTLLRISGAMQVLTELIEEEQPAPTENPIAAVK